MLGDRRLDGGHDHVLVILSLDVVDCFESEDPGRHVAKHSDHAGSLSRHTAARQALPVRLATPRPYV